MTILCREAKNTEMKETLDAVSGGQEGAKDRKIIELAKKNRLLQTQVESLKTKAAKATELALKFKAQTDKKEPPVISET